MIKILIISTYPPLIGGISIHASRLYEKLLDKGSGIHPYKLDASELKKCPLIFLKKLLYFVLNKRIKYFHIHSAKNPWLFLIIYFFSKPFGGKYILTVHSGLLIDWLSSSKSISAYFLKLSFFLSNKIIIVNEQDLIHLKRIYPKLKDKFFYASPFIIPNNAINKRHINPKSKYLRISVVGLWQPLYRFEDVINVCEKLSIKNKNVRIKLTLLASTAYIDNEYKSKIISKIDSINQKNVLVIIKENIKNIFDHYFLQDIVIRSSDIDSFGLCVAESLLVGTTTIATDVCKRPTNTLLYKPRDVNELEKIIEIINSTNNKYIKTNKKSLFVDLDGYAKILEIYKMLTRCAI